MRSQLLAASVALVCVVSFAAASARGQFIPLGWEQSYRVLPRLSVLVLDQPDREAPTIPYHVRGTFDFHVAPSVVAVFPPMFGAKFVDPVLDAVHPIQDDVLDVDEIFNLDGLHGTAQSRLFPYRPPLFRFHGENDEGARVRLDALVRGRWLYLRGGTQYPDDAETTGPTYHLWAIARVQPSGDLNGDGIVDAADFREWLNRPERLGGDFLEWQRSIGEVPPSLDVLDAELSAALSAASTAIPEPAAGTLAIVATMGLAAARRRRHNVA
jgi:hypothetical protein